MQNPEVQVGEIGLDFVGEHTPETKKFQTEVFEKQLDMAISKFCLQELNRVCSVHCVRAHGEMLKLLKKKFGGKAGPKSTQIGQEDHSVAKNDHAIPTLIMHSFGGSKEIAESLAKLSGAQIYFSFCQIKAEVKDFYRENSRCHKSYSQHSNSHRNR